jgi:phosphodiesterase/alkaline phosphatase D-like protein
LHVQGVASGDPFPKSIILWTRVTVAAQNKPATLVRCLNMKPYTDSGSVMDCHPERHMTLTGGMHGAAHL